jgi:cyclopropane-fatty-acyl-phospholipid synthase
LADGSLGAGEAYVDGWWNCEKLDAFFARILLHGVEAGFYNWKDACCSLKAKFFNLQNRKRAYQVGRHHYDIGNDLYERMLDKRMIYSCAYWGNATDLDKAQEAKLDLVCRKLRLEPGMQVLDIGCGWGGTAQFVAECYGVNVVGITISAEQARLAQQRCNGLPVEIRLVDYRSLGGKFDRILSIGMFEHVGYRNYRKFMQVVRGLLKEDGLFLLHTIGNNRSMVTTDKWIEKYVFPNSMLPSAKQISSAFEGLFVLEDWHNFGPDYDLTLTNWFGNFNENWSDLQNKYGQRFYRLWKYYLLSCAGSFRARVNQLWQIVLSPRGVAGGYSCLR